MGHITVDRLEDAWKKLNKAERLIDADQTHASVLECENALGELYRSADGMGFGVWFSSKEDPIRETIFELKRDAAPNADETKSLIEDCRELVKETREKVIPELHDRIDYNPTPNFEKYS